MAGLADTRVLLTGGTSGLGRAMAEALVKARARVALTGRDRSRADTIAEQLGLSATGLELDVRDEASVQSGVEARFTPMGAVFITVRTLHGRKRLTGIRGTLRKAT